jgi:hypothetical protein
MSWGTWEEERRYPSNDCTHLIVVSKPTNSEGRVFWKNERRPLSPADRALLREPRRLARPRAELTFHVDIAA